MISNKIATTILVILILSLMLPTIKGIPYTTISKAEAAINQPQYMDKVLNKKNITEINIEISQADWNWLIENAAKKEPRNCTVTINGTTFYNVAINPKGNSTLTTIINDKNSDRFSFKLDFGKYVKEQTCFGLRKISLNNIYADKTYMKEYLSYDLFDFMGVPTPAYAFTNIKLNGNNWGLYLAVENMEESFIERNFGTTEGNLYKPESMDMGGAGEGFQERGRLFPNVNNQNNPNDNKITNQPSNEGAQSNKQPGDDRIFPGNLLDVKGTDLKYIGDEPKNYSNIKENAILKTTNSQEFKKVITMIKNLNDGKNLESYLDVDEILRYFAVNTFLVNLDSYSGGMFHNYYLYERDGKFKILPWDLNMSFAGFGVNSGTEAINFPIDKPVKGTLEDAPLIGKLLEVPEYKERYHIYLRQIIENYIKSGVFQNSVYTLDKMINSYVKTDATAFITYDDYSRAIPILVTFGQERADSVSAQLNGEQPSTTYGTWPTTVDLAALGSMQMGRGNGQNKEGGMFDLSKMSQIMAIIEESAGKPLTPEQTQRLLDLGLDEDMINNMRSLGISENQYIKYYLYIGLPIAVLLVGILFVIKFKRKNFRAY